MSTLKFNKNEVMKLVSDLSANSKVEIVRDEGVYLMAFDKPLSGGPRVIVYAKGCDPAKDADWYDTKRDVYGGDDGGDTICTAGQLKNLVMDAVGDIKVILTATQIKIECDRYVQQPKKQEIDWSKMPESLRKKYNK